MRNIKMEYNYSFSNLINTYTHASKLYTFFYKGTTNSVLLSHVQVYILIWKFINFNDNDWSSFCIPFLLEKRNQLKYFQLINFILIYKFSHLLYIFRRKEILTATNETFLFRNSLHIVQLSSWTTNISFSREQPT